MKTKILDWLNKTGYPLELKAESILTKNQFRVFNSLYYKDPERGVAREIDLHAVYEISDNDISLDINLLIECKSSKKPFILLKKINDKYKGFHVGSNYLVSNPMSSALFNNLNINTPSPKSQGFKLIQAHTNSDETIHKAAHGLHKSFDYWSDGINKLIQEYANDNAHDLTIPILVLDASLFDLTLNSEERLELNEIESGVWEFKTGVEPDHVFHIIIVNINSLEELIKNIKKYSITILNFLKDNPKNQIKNAFKTKK